MKPDRKVAVGFDPLRGALRTALLAGTSLVALIIASNQGEARSLLTPAGTPAPTVAAQQAATAAAIQAQASLARASAALNAMRKAQEAAAAAAAAGGALAQPRLDNINGRLIPNGVEAGGLMPSGGVTPAGFCDSAPSCSRFQLNTPSAFKNAAPYLDQTVDGGQTTVDITQTQKNAIYNWDSFNVSRSTRLNFNQDGSDWIALNRVNPSTSPTLFIQNTSLRYNNPSYIGGQITAPGAVYVINRNGIIFGAGAQINTQSFIASTLDVGKLGFDQVARDQYFLNTGIGNPFSFSVFDSGGATTTTIPGDITVQAGASINAHISTDVVPLGSPGFVYLFGANVYNSGTLTAPEGQVAMAASRAITLTPGTYQAASFPSEVLPSDVTFRGTGLQIQNFVDPVLRPIAPYTESGTPQDLRYQSGTGQVTSSGLIETRTGIVTLAGDRITMPGVISADTGITRNSMVLMHAATSVDMNGVISVLPYDDGNTLPNQSGGSGSAVQSYTPAYIELSAQRSVTVGSSGLISAPAASVSLNAVTLGGNSNVVGSGSNVNVGRQLFSANGEGTQGANPSLEGPQQVVLASSDGNGPGATIDVAGLQNVQLPATYNFIEFQPQGNEFADMPLQRDGVLLGQKMWIDIRATGTRSDGTTWVGTPVADASGAVGSVGRSIFQLMTSGGAVDLRTDLRAADSGIATSIRQVVSGSGSIVNVGGGSVQFLPGMVSATALVGIDGRIYSMANADPNMVYVGIAGQFTSAHPNWGVRQKGDLNEIWSNLTQSYQPGYTEGHDAGGVAITTVSPQLGGSLLFGSAAGQRQTTLGRAPSDTGGGAVTRPTPLQAMGDELPSQGYLALTTPSSVQIGPAPSALFKSSDVVTQLSADTLSGYGLSALSIKSFELALSSGSTLKLAPGGQFSASAAGAIDIAGNISAPGGAISLLTDREKLSADLVFPFDEPIDPNTGKVLAANIWVEGSLDVSGRFVNDIGQLGIGARGPGFINGGTISISTSKSSGRKAESIGQDTTGSIRLASGSVLDVSSGGYISPQAKRSMASARIMAGKAGSISLLLYQGGNWLDPPTTNPDKLRPTFGPLATLQLDGTMRAYGFESNGSLRLGAADTIRIGGTLQPDETSTISIGGVLTTLPVEWLTSGKFGSYTLESVPDGWSGAEANITVSAGVDLTLQQKNLSSFLDYRKIPTDTNLARLAESSSDDRLQWLPVDWRKPVNLTLKASTVLLDTGSSIVTDPQANITFGGSPLPEATGVGRDQPAQEVLLRGSIVDHGGTVSIQALRTWLDAWSGDQARIDLSGTFIENTDFRLPGGSVISGQVIAGGTFSVEASQLTQVGTTNVYVTDKALGGSYLVADGGFQVDVSGSAGIAQVLAGRGVTSSVSLWSDAGTVSANVAGFAWGGTFGAQGGDPRANNGTFIVGGGAVSLQQDASAINMALAAFHSGGTPASIFIAANQLASFDNVYLYSGRLQGGAASIFTDLPGSKADLSVPELDLFTITGTLNWAVGNRLHIAASSVISATDGASVTINAPYVELTGGSGTVSQGTSSLNVNAHTIDVEGAAFSRFGYVQLASSGDIRLSTQKVVNRSVPSDTAPNKSSFAGSLTTSGDLLLSAQRIYPVSAVDFTIKTPGDVKFAAPAGSNTTIPLSAGGGITVIANTIEQAGNLFAPLGTITLGNSDPAISSIITQSVTLAPGSLTSVSLADTVVPYGATLDGSNWYYNANINPLSQPPAKGLVLSAADVAVTSGSIIDIRGGGDLQAIEWIQGKGGSRDTLTTTPSGQMVYALVPSANDPVAAFDIHFATTRSLDNGQTIAVGDTVPLAGTQITIAGGSGIPAGTYTLYPAHYATLPGAMRVVYYGDNLGHNVPSGTKLPDGTVLVTGNYSQSTLPGRQSSGQAIFAVQSGSVWQQYSEFSFAGANSYFAQRASHDGKRAPPLPIDAGRVAVIAQQSILLAGTALTQPAAGGRGSELDITADKLAIVSHDQYVNAADTANAPADHVAIDVTQINSFGFESVLIGGVRSNPTTDGTLITPTATDVLVDTRGDTLSVPEILLVAKQGAGEWQLIDQSLMVGSTQVDVRLPIFVAAANTGSVTIKTGSSIQTRGMVHTGLGRNYYVAPADYGGNTPAQQVAMALGGVLDPTGTIITGANLALLNALWSNGSQSQQSGANDATIANYAFYAYGGSTTQKPGLGALFAASNDSTLAISGPTGGVPALTIQFADVTGGPLNSSGPATMLDGRPASVVLPGTEAGRIAIEAGARISTDTLTLQATAQTDAITIKTSDLHANQLNLAAQTIAIGGTTPVAGKSLQLYDHQFADVQGLLLKPLTGAISVYGNFDPGPAIKNLTLDAAALIHAGNNDNAKISVNGGAVTLVNTGGAAASASLPSSSGGPVFAIEAADIVLNGGAQSIAGYSAVNFAASNRIFIAGSGTLTLGSGDTDQVDLNVITPTVLVGGATSNGAFTFTTRGNVKFADVVARNGLVERPADNAEIGGNLAITAKSITVANTIQAQAGLITLRATTGDVTLDNGAYLAAGGYEKTLVDYSTFVSGGTVLLQADAGSVRTSIASTIDVAQPESGPGYGGQILISAAAGDAALSGRLMGQGGLGLGGSFTLDTKGAIDLDHVARLLGEGGLTGEVDIRTRTGNLNLSSGNTLRANSVTLVADDTTWDDAAGHMGQVIIAGTIDARGYGNDLVKTLNGTGQAGGQVGLWGANAVTLTSTGVIDASTEHSDERGGDVTFGIAWDVTSWDPTRKTIDLQPNSVIDVHGGTKGGLSGGTVRLRAPLDGNDGIRITQIKSTFKGARTVTVEGFVAFSTTDVGGINAGANGNVKASDGTKVIWDGIIDPAGRYGTNDLKLSGTWSSLTGVTLGTGGGGSYTSVPTITFNTPDGGTPAKAVAVMGLNAPPSIANSGLPPGTYSVTFPTPAGGAAATGTAVVDQSGRMTFSIINPGRGYTGVPTTVSLFAAGRNQTISLSLATLRVVSVSITDIGSGYAVIPTVTLTGGGGSGATVTLTQGGGFTGRSVNGVFTETGTTTYIPFGNGIFNQMVSGSAVFTSSNPVNTQHSLFYTDVLKQVVQGTWTYDGHSFGFGNVISKLELDTLGRQLGAGVLHVQPGVDLVNPTSSINGGNITVASNWNLAAGQAANLGGTSTTPTYTHVYENPSNASYVAFDYRYVADYGGTKYVEPGALTLRAVGNIDVNASISDGFFQFRDYLNQNYITSISNYLGNNWRGVDPTGTSPFTDPRYAYYLNTNKAVPTAPYKAAANGASPTSADLAAADLFPNQLRVCVNCGGRLYAAGTSYSVRSSGGDFTSGRSFTVSAATSITVGIVSVTVELPDGTRSIFGPALSQTLEIPAGAKVTMTGSGTVSFSNSLVQSTVGSTATLALPNLVTITEPTSWSYRFTAGADPTSANPSPSRTTRIGDVTINNHVNYAQTLYNDANGGLTQTTVSLPTLVRTGTGDIRITASRDVVLSDVVAPGAVYAAGVNTPRLVDPHYNTQMVNGVSTVVTGDPISFAMPALAPISVGAGAALTLPSKANLSFADGTPAGGKIQFTVNVTVTDNTGKTTDYAANTAITLTPGSTVTLKDQGTMTLASGTVPVNVTSDAAATTVLNYAGARVSGTVFDFGQSSGSPASDAVYFSTSGFVTAPNGAVTRFAADERIAIPAGGKVMLDAPGTMIFESLGFFEPQVVAYGNYAVNTGGRPVYGPPTAAAFPYKGGDVDIEAQRDIVGYIATTKTVAAAQYFRPWLLADAELSPAQAALQGASVNTRGAGVFAPLRDKIASQAAWWIQYGSFQQGFLSAGGNVSVTAGRDLRDVSVSLPTTGRVSGGLSAGSTPVTHIYDSGNMVVRAGRHILGGSFYEGSGHATIIAGGSVGQSGILTQPGRNSTTLTTPNVPLLAVDLGQIALIAGGSISTAGVVNPAALHAQHGSFANSAAGQNASIYMDTYGPNSGASLLAVTGDVTINIPPTAMSAAGTARSSSVYPGSFEAIALGGDIVTTGLQNPNAFFSAMPGLVLSGSEHGSFRLLAEGNIDLTFGSPGGGATVVRPYISAGPALLDKAFDPFRPNAWEGAHPDDNSFGGAFSEPVLAHRDDDDPAKIYAATGDITAVGLTFKNAANNTITQTRVEINRPADIYAGRDIVDLNMIVQNIQADDVSTVKAGRDIAYTGLNPGGGLEIAGPGYFVVEAGRDLGPFLPAAFNNSDNVVSQQGIVSVGNASMTPVGNTFITSASNGGATGLSNTALLGPVSSVNKRRNALLGGQGANIITMFGVANGINYDGKTVNGINPGPGVFQTYVDPANAANVAHNYFDEMLNFLTRIGRSAGGDPLATFKSLPTELQHVFLDQVFFTELKAVGLSQQEGAAQYSRGYAMINTMFPASLGYTANGLDGGSNGANQIVKTGDLTMLHGTIQTLLGGDISIFGPGGNIIAGSLGTESNQNLELRDLGILTLGGGAINTFTDQSVLVNSSRVLTTQGGDVLMWSSNLDLDAGRGSRTTLSLPPLQVLFDNNDYQSVDLGGFVSGAGIGVLKSSKVAKSSNLYLLAPRGKVDAGAAGIRVSGNLVVGALVVLNTSNIQVQGTSTGIPVVSVPSINALTSASSTAGAAARTAEPATASGGNRDRASVFIVEVVGYGGDTTGSVPAGSDTGGTAAPAGSSSPGGSTPSPTDASGGARPQGGSDNEKKDDSEKKEKDR